MQFKLAFVSAGLATLAVATPTPRDTCTTGTLQCCDTVEPATSSGIPQLLGLLGIVLQNVNVNIGLGCDPLSVVDLGSGTCTAQAACCEDNSSSLISIGCLPIQI